jgi:hypothetical protein
MFYEEIGSNYLAVSEKIQQIFPHIENTSIFFHSTNELKYLENGKFLEISTFISSKLLIFRKVNLSYQWMLPSEIFEFYETEGSKIHQLDLLSEHDNRLLLLSFKSEIDGLNDLVCLTFPKEIRFLGLYKTVKNLTTEDKILIGELLYKIIEVELVSQNKLIKKQNRIAEYFKLKGTLNTNLTNEDYYKFILSELNQGLYFLLNRKIQFEFDKELIDYVINKNYSIKVICEYLKDSFETIELIEQINGRFKFELFHFKLIENEKPIKNTMVYTSSNNNDKTIDLLNKLENAAKIIESKGMVINGKSIAQNIVPPVSPPAITDILKKNISKIENKMKEYPSNWQLIRKYLKPLRELEFKQYIEIYNQKIG